MDVSLFSSRYTVRALTEADVPQVYALCRQNPLFYQYCPPFVTPKSIRADMQALPPRKTLADKYYMGYFADGELIAVLDYIHAYPDEHTGFIGFFMLRADRQGRGEGSAIIADLCRQLLHEGMRALRLGWVQGNPQAEHFWHKNGFVETGLTNRNENYTMIIAQRALDAVPAARKAVFLDIDGTLSYHSEPPCQADIDALRRLRAAGHYVLINTGRARGFLPDCLRDADYLDGFVCGCGTQLILHGQSLFKDELPRPLLRQVAAFYLARPGRRCLFEGEDSLYITGGDYKGVDWPLVTREDDFETVYAHAHISKLTVLGRITPEEEALFAGRLHTVLQSVANWYEAVLPGCDKGRGLLHACEKLGVLPQDSIAIGDSENDLDMLACAGTAVAMANSTASALAAADYVTGACGEGGVAQAVLALMFGEGQVKRAK